MGFSLRHKGSFDKTEKFLETMSEDDIFKVLEAAARVGVSALAAATPIESGDTADLWGYEVEKSQGGYRIYWTNDHVHQGFYVVIGLHYGHATGTGGYVVGRDFINPTIRPMFDALAETLWKEVINA